MEDAKQGEGVDERSCGVYVGRFAPFHSGHCKVVGNMIKKYELENCLFVIGSCNASLSMRHLFSYEERREIIRSLYPEAKVVGLPDFPTDREWLLALDDILRIANIDPMTCEFQGGCLEDIEFFADAGRRYCLTNRFDVNTSVKISATEVRDCLIRGESLNGMVEPQVIPVIQGIFQRKWAMLKRL